MAESARRRRRPGDVPVTRASRGGAGGKGVLHVHHDTGSHVSAFGTSIPAMEQVDASIGAGGSVQLRFEHGRDSVE